jgi:hypothetical protein
MITFAVFHSEIPRGLREKIVPHRSGATSDYASLADMTIRSAELFHPNCGKVILTNRTTNFPGLTQDVQVLRYDIDPSKIMFERASVQREFLRQHDFRSHVLLIDSDMLLNGEFESTFYDSFDVGLTYRHSVYPPINGALIAVHRSCRKPALAFFDNVIRLMQEDHPDNLAWYGDQYALMEAVGKTAFLARRSDRIESAAGIRIALWPCDTHNYSPPDEWPLILLRRSNRRIIHFKGDLKELMQPYWRAHLADDRTPAQVISSLAAIAWRAQRRYVVSHLMQAKKIASTCWGLGWRSR